MLLTYFNLSFISICLLSHHPQEHKLGVIRTLEDEAKKVPTSMEGKQKELSHIKKAEKFRRTFKKHKIQVNFKPGQTLRQRLVHPKDKTPRNKLSNVVCAVQCTEECSDCIGNSPVSRGD